MQEAWIPLQCPACGERWEESPSDLPAPNNEFVCVECNSKRSIAEFIETQRGLEILKEFHA